MPPLTGIKRALQLALGRRGVERAVDDELRFHLEMRVEDLTRLGMSRDEAFAQARKEFGDVEQSKRDLSVIDHRRVARVARIETWLGVLQDARVALRGYKRHPAFAVVVILTLAVGIAATTVAFSVVNAVLLRPLPYAQPDRLVQVWEAHESDMAARVRASYPTFLDWHRDAASMFVALAGYDVTNVAVRAGDGTEWMDGARVTPGFFATLGVAPLLGRFFTEEDDRAGGARAVVLSHETFTRFFSADERVVGRTVIVDGGAYEVRGVLPPRFRFAPAGDVELWFPAGRSDEVRAQRFNHWLAVVGRLRDGVTAEMAEARLAQVMRRLAAEYPESNAGRTALVKPLRDEVVGGVERQLVVLFAAVGLVLLIACANVASLVLARSIERAREIAVRWALGGSRARMVRQLLTENLVLAIAGAVLGAWLAFTAVPLLVAAIPQSLFNQAPALRDTRVDLAALAFTSIVAVIVGVALGLIPGLLTSRFSAADVLRADGRVGAGRTSHRLRDAIVAAEIALTLVLLVGAALMGRSLVALLSVDAGFTSAGVATVRAALPADPSDNAARMTRFFEDALARARSLPGVQTAGAVSSAPLQGSGTNTFRVDGAPEPPPAARLEAVTRAVAGDYFGALRIPLRRGRAVDARDNLNAPYAVVINESLAHRLFGADDAVGRKVRFYHWEDSAWTIVGVAGDVKTDALDRPVRPTIYYSHLQGPANRMTILARTASAEPASLIAPLRRAIGELDPSVATYQLGTMDDHVGRTQAVYRRRSMLVVLGTFAIAALLLVIIGIYGVISYGVTQRTREIAIRIALGATGGSVVGLVLRHGLRLVIVGVGIGSIAALALSRALSSLLFGVSAADVWTYTLAAALVVVVALAASYLPARRATRFDPAISLRSE